MATAAQAQSVKSLNNSSSGNRQRFVFKTFAERIDEINVDVYRSLDKVKLEPSQGSFFLDCLVEWRELNTAEDFISLYEKLMPYAQTLPLVLIHKNLIFEELLSRLHIKARLSLEAILRSIAGLSRDLLEEFVPFLPRIADSLLSLLQSGADREPEIIEQIFTSWSYIIVNLQKDLVQDVSNVLKFTIGLRYYSKGYVQEFMAAATSFLLRNTSKEQLIKGIGKLISEVVKKPLLTWKNGVSGLLYYAMRGTSSRLHSKAKRILHLLTSDSIFVIGDKHEEGSDTIIEVVSSTLQRLCDELEQEELNKIWSCLYKKIEDCITKNQMLHLSRILSLTISIVQIQKGRKVPDYQQLLEHIGLIVQKLIVPSGTSEVGEYLSEVRGKIFTLMLFVLEGLHSSNNFSMISQCSVEWMPVFELRDMSCLTFITELMEKDPYILSTFRDNIWRAMDNMIESSTKDVVYLLVSLCEKLENPISSEKTSESAFLRICSFLQEMVSSWICKIRALVDDATSVVVDESELALLWGVINCFRYMLGFEEYKLKENMKMEAVSSSLTDLIDAFDRFMSLEIGISKNSFLSLIGAALRSYAECGQDTKKVMDLSRKYKSSTQVLSAVANYLDHVLGLPEDMEHQDKAYHPEFQGEKATEAFCIYGDNLFNQDKRMRVATLKILRHYGTPDCESRGDEQPTKKLKNEVSQAWAVTSSGFDVVRLILSIETAALSVSTSRKVILLISRIQMELSNGRISRAYLPIILSGMSGMFHNRFSYLWNPATECLAVLINQHFDLVWDKFIHYFEHCLALFWTSGGKQGEENDEKLNGSKDLLGLFKLVTAPASESTPCSTVLSSLLQTLQKVPSHAESRSRQIIPLFFKFLGYKNDSPASVGSFDVNACKGKEWKCVLNEWLNLLKLMRNPKAFYRSQFVKDVLYFRLMDENDAELQLKVLDCLLTWKDAYLFPYEQHLKKLISSKGLREELTTWSLSKESQLIEESHRTNLVPLTILLLMPKVRNLKMLASRKHTSLYHRKAVLGFLAQLDVNEIPFFFALLLKPFHVIASKGDDATADFFWTLSNCSVVEFHQWNILDHFNADKIMELSWKKRYAFLHLIEDILGVFDESRVMPFLDLLMGCVVRMLSSCKSTVKDNYEKDDAEVSQALASSSLKQMKDLRSLCLKIISLVLNKYDDHDFGVEFWDMFFTSVKPLIDRFKVEGASSEKPSSLFSCFLAISSSHQLVPLLLREKNLVPNIFSILTVTTASEAVISCSLKFIKNLLVLDEELEDEDNRVKEILLPNIDELIGGLHFLFQRDASAKRKTAKYLGESCIGIFKLLSKYVKDLLLGKRFMEVLLPLLSRKAKDPSYTGECLKIIQDIVPVIGRECTTKILDSVSAFLVSCETDLRLSVCDLLDALAKSDDSVALLAKLIRGLNATSAFEVDDRDLDTILTAYKMISVEFYRDIKEEHAIVVLSHCIYDMSSDVYILRQSAYSSLLLFVEFSSQILDGTVHQYETQVRAKDSESSWTRACIQRIINKFLLKHMGNVIKAGSLVTKEWIDLMQGMIVKLPNVEGLNSCKPLCSEDPEQDFFYNITHIQKHRRAKALSRFKNVVGKNNISEGILNSLFVPLFFNMLLDVQDKKGEHIKTACLEALASISGNMGWKSYYGLLMRCFREIKTKKDMQKILVRLICSILEQFHFSATEIGRPVHTSSSEDSGMLRKCSYSRMETDIQSSLQETVLPKIQKLLGSDSGHVNVNISLAALKVLKLLPGDVMDSQLPSIMHRIANQLKNHLESVRDEARLALAACLKELGLEYLQFIVKVMQAMLKRGYELHVLGYSLHFILSKSLANSIHGKLDYCLTDLLSVVENDILGDVAEEKEVEKIASKMKETKKQKSFETLQMIAQNVTFKSHALKLLSPVTANMQKHLTPKVKNKLESMLSHIAAGLERNPSVEQSDLFVFTYGLIEDGLNEENSQGKNPNIDQPIKHDCDLGGKASALAVGTTHSNLITVFALGLFHSQIKSLKMVKDNEILSMLDPYVKLLANCLSSKYEDVLSACLKCLAPLIRLPLPSLESHADKIKLKLLDIAQSSMDANSPLMQSCLKLLSVLLRSTKVTLSSDQLHSLVQFPLFLDLDRNPSVIALSLLKAIVGRKLVVPEIYDIALRVGQLMVTSQIESIRKKCSQILLQFLLDYHLSETYLQQQMDFLLKNLSYEYSTGREAVLEMLHAVIIKFPKSFLDKHSLPLFIHLVQRLVNDDHGKVCLMTGAVIKLLIGRISQHFADSILDYSLSWYMDKKRQLKISGAQALELLIEVMGKNFKKHINVILPVVKSILQSAVDFASGRPSEENSDDSFPLWKEAYFTLVMLEKILQHFQDLSFEKDLEDIWESVSRLLLHPHAWLRNISSRVLAFYFVTASNANRVNREKSVGSDIIMRPDRLFVIAASLCFQLHTKSIDDTAGKLIAENLVFAVCTINSLIETMECRDPCKFWSSLKEHEKGRLLSGFQLLDSEKGRDKFLRVVSNSHSQDGGSRGSSLQHLLVSSLIKKMGKISLQGEAIQMKTVFSSFEKITSQFNSDSLQRYSYDILLPLYKVCEGYAGKVISDDLKQLAGEVCESVRNSLGIQNFINTYNEVKTVLKGKREKRKREEKLMPVVDPVRNAKRKLKMAAKHRAHKKRKIMTMKMGRWMR